MIHTMKFHWISIILLFISCAPNNKSPQPAVKPDEILNTVKDRIVVVDEKTQNVGMKINFERHILISGTVSYELVENLLHKQYNEMKDISVSRNYTVPVHTYAYVYDSIDKAQAGSGLWIGMLEGDIENDNPNISIKLDKIKLLSTPSEQKFGYSEKERMKIFRESVATESRAMDDALKQYQNDIKKLSGLANELQEKYKNQVAKKYKISPDDLFEIESEGIEKQWAW